ncbi:hypothetical protein FRC00_005065, partial [Tulasnella sp. 408]
MNLVQETDWPKEALNDAQALMQTVEAPFDLDNLPMDEMQIPAEIKREIKLLLRELESAHTKLKPESEKYGTKKKGIRKELRKLFSPTDPSQCTEVLRSCRTDVEESWATLHRLLNNLASATEQHTLQAAEDEHGRDDSARLPGPHGSATSTTAGFGPPLSPVQSNSLPTPSASTPQVGNGASVQAGKQKGSSLREELLNGANKALKIAEGVSGAIPVVGSYVGAVAKVGLTVVEMVQVSWFGRRTILVSTLIRNTKAMDSNNETAEKLGSHVCRLSEILERVSSRARIQERSETTNGMEDLQR